MGQGVAQRDHAPHRVSEQVARGGLEIFEGNREIVDQLDECVAARAAAR
jgi:hypothetical protein